MRRCRVCGCTDLDCSDCIERTGRPCLWVLEDLCSACSDLFVSAEEILDVLRDELRESYRSYGHEPPEFLVEESMIPLPACPEAHKLADESTEPQLTPRSIRAGIVAQFQEWERAGLIDSADEFFSDPTSEFLSDPTPEVRGPLE